jgi:uncharacterized protein GlcG (DUF336 family)
VTDAFVTRPSLTLATARRLIDAASAHAEQIGVALSLAVLDAGGHEIATARMDGAALGTMRLAVDKAYTAALWQIPSGDLHESSQPGGDDWGVTSTEGGRIVVYQGGLPVFHDGELAGAMGASGGTAEQDAECVRTAIETVLPSS